MFQTGSVQRNAFQLGGASRTSAAFQQGAFQGGAFQVYSGSVTPPDGPSAAFQQGAFQGGAFQVYSGYQDTPVVPPPPPPPTITGGWSDWMPRKPRIKDEDDEPEIETPAPREVVKTDKVVTGVVQYASPLPPWPKSDVSAKFARMENESRIEYRKRIRRIIAADDEWLMLH